LKEVKAQIKVSEMRNENGNGEGGRRYYVLACRDVACPSEREKKNCKSKLERFSKRNL
jgi:hypothetical protein